MTTQVRGYAYQTGPAQSTADLNLLPMLEEVGSIAPVTLDNARLSPMTIAGTCQIMNTMINLCN